MASSAEPKRPDRRMSGMARSLSRVGLVLFVVFGTVIAGPLLALRLLQPAWQWQFSGVMLSSASLPLVGLVLLQLAAALDPADAVLQRRHRRYASLAVAACVGFVLLVPLQIWSGLVVQQKAGDRREAQMAAVERQLKAMRAAVGEASSAADLAARFQAIKAPALISAPPTAPLAAVQRQANAAIDRAEGMLAAQRRQLGQPQPLQALPDLLRNSIASLALAVGFAALARQPGASQSLLDHGLRLRLRLRPTLRRRSSNRANANAYLRELRKHHTDT